MKITKTLSALALASLLMISCNDKSKDGTIETNTDSTVTDTTMVKETAANLETTSFKIDGMTCAIGCAATIEQKLAKLDGVDNAEVDFETKTATVSFDAAKQTPEKLVETVEGIADGAYKVSDVKSSGDKAFYSVDQEKEKKKEAKKKAKGSKDEKAGCCSAKKGEGKSCCASEGKKTAAADTKSGNL